MTRVVHQLGPKIRDAIRLSGKTIAEVARELEVDASYLQRLMNGTHVPTADRLAELSISTGMSTDELLGLTAPVIVGERLTPEEREALTAFRALRQLNLPALRASVVVMGLALRHEVVASALAGAVEALPADVRAGDTASGGRRARKVAGRPARKHGRA